MTYLDANVDVGSARCSMAPERSSRSRTRRGCLASPSWRLFLSRGPSPHLIHQHPTAMALVGFSSKTGRASFSLQMTTNPPSSARWSNKVRDDLQTLLQLAQQQQEEEEELPDAPNRQEEERPNLLTNRSSSSSSSWRILCQRLTQHLDQLAAASVPSCPALRTVWPWSRAQSTRLTRLLTHLMNLPSAASVNLALDDSSSDDDDDDDDMAPDEEDRCDDGNENTPKSGSESPTAAAAAALYIRLLAWPGGGAWGADLVKVEPCLALLAFLRQWRAQLWTDDRPAAKTLDFPDAGVEKEEENEPDWVEQATALGRTRAATGASAPATAPHFFVVQPAQRKWRSSHPDTLGQIMSIYPTKEKENNPEEIVPAPFATNRPQAQQHGPDYEEEDEEEEEEKDAVSGDDDDDDDDLVARGLTVALALADLPRHSEFWHYSSDARDALMEALLCVWSTAAALLATGKSTRQRLSAPTRSLARQVVDRVGRAWEQSLVPDPATASHHDPNPDSNRDDDDDDDDLPNARSSTSATTSRHETWMVLMRGLYPMVLRQVTLPQGEAGQAAASTAAAQLLPRFIQGLSRRYASRGSPPLATPGVNAAATTPHPPRRRAPSDGTTTPAETCAPRPSMGRTSLTPPKIKGSKTPATSSTTHRLSLSESVTTTRMHPLLRVMLGFLQKLATHSTLNRAPLRSHVVSILSACIQHFPHQEQSLFLTFLIKLCHSKLPVHRLVAVDTIGLFLGQDWLWSETGLSRTTNADWTTPAPRSRLSLTPLLQKSTENLPQALLGALLGRLLDRAPTIRAACATRLADLFRQLAERLQEQVDDDDDDDDDVMAGDNNKSWHSKCPAAVGLLYALQEDAGNWADLLRRRALTDDKATVRRASVQAWSVMMTLSPYDPYLTALTLAEPDLELLVQIGRGDASALTRKAAAEALQLWWEHGTKKNNNVVPNSIQAALENAWVRTVMAMVLDPETSCATKAVELVDQVVLAPILNDTSTARNSDAAWRMLTLICGGVGGDSSAARTGTHALYTVLSKRTQADPNTTKLLLKKARLVALETLVDQKDELRTSLDDRRIGCWSLLEAFVCNSNDIGKLQQVAKRNIINLDFVATSWEKLLDLAQSLGLPVHYKEPLLNSVHKCLRVFAKLSESVDKLTAQKSADKLRDLLDSFAFPIEMIGSAVAAHAAICVSCLNHDDATLKGDQPSKEACSAWIRGLFDRCRSELYQRVEHPIDTNCATLISRALFTAGELSLVGFAGHDEANEAAESAKGNRETDGKDRLRGICVLPNGDLIELVQCFLATRLPGMEHSTIPEAVRAHAFVTLGKFCLRNERLAKQSVILLARELHENMVNGRSTIQSNALLVLGDLCVRYTNLVDRHLPVMAACMQAGATDMNSSVLRNEPKKSSSLVRQHAVLLLSNLLLQDYIKWRGLLFHRFLVATADEDDDVAQLAEEILFGSLMTRYPKLLLNNFVESLFVLNRCTAHPIYQAACATGDGGSGVVVGLDEIVLSGEVGRCKRMFMYELMLTHMTDEEKIGITARISKEVLGSALEEGSDLHSVCTTSLGPSSSAQSEAHYESAFNVMSDALAVLSNPLIRVGKSAGQVADETEDPDQTSTRRRVLAAKGRLLSKISRKHLIEIMLPILCRLKVLLQSSHSSLLKPLMTYLVEVFRMFNTEVKEYLAGDATLLQELEYDMKQLRKERNRRPSMGQETSELDEVH